MMHSLAFSETLKNGWDRWRCDAPSCGYAVRVKRGASPPEIEGCGVAAEQAPVVPSPIRHPVSRVAVETLPDTPMRPHEIVTTTERDRRFRICGRCAFEQQKECAPPGCYSELIHYCKTGQCKLGKWYVPPPETTPPRTERVDIIVPTYRNEQLTAACFRSIRENTKPGSYRIIWVDNGSGDLSVPMAELVGVNFILIELAANRGFVDATNEGLRVSDREFVCLLNNDTVVSSRWMDKMIAALAANDKLGIVGPFTSYGTHDSHHCLSLHPTLLPPEAESWDLETINRAMESSHAGKIYPISFVAFLCALIRREVIDKVGLLDANYDLGMYDDTDYNRAAQQAGFDIGLTMDTCIYHRGRSTFQILEKTGLNVRQLLLKNKTYLDRKWGER